MKNRKQRIPSKLAATGGSANAGIGGLRKLKQKHSWDEDDSFKQAMAKAVTDNFTTNASMLQSQEEMAQPKKSTKLSSLNNDLNVEKVADATSSDEEDSRIVSKRLKKKTHSVTNVSKDKGKLFQMRKYSRKVGTTIKASHEDRNKRDVRNKANAVKFRKGRKA